MRKWGTMDQSAISLHSITIFLRVVREGSFSKAGRTLGLSPTAVSRQIAGLEAAFGGPLFHRSSRKLGLTEAGREYHRRIAPVMEEMRKANEAIAFSNTNASGTLRVHCRTMVGMLIVAPAIPRFLSEHPDIQLAFLVSNETAIDMVGGDFDVDIQVGERADSALRARLLTQSTATRSPALRARGRASETGLTGLCLAVRRGSGRGCPRRG